MDGLEETWNGTDTMLCFVKLTPWFRDSVETAEYTVLQQAQAQPAHDYFATTGGTDSQGTHRLMMPTAWCHFPNNLGRYFSILLHNSTGTFLVQQKKNPPVPQTKWRKVVVRVGSRKRNERRCLSRTSFIRNEINSP